VILMRANAQASAIRTIAGALQDPHSAEAAKLAVAREVPTVNVSYVVYVRY
jgi:hypothetical protein